MNKTGIEYLDYTYNPTHGCSKVSAGCENCWARVAAVRLAGMGAPGYDKAKPFAVTFHPDRIDEPLKIKKPALIGVSFMGDLFHKEVTDMQIAQVYDVMERARQHTFVVLTKRPERMMWFSRKYTLPANVWPGTSVENQAAADERVPWLLLMDARVRVVSCEPLLEQVSLRPYFKTPGLQWVIAGCESGRHRRFARIEWFTELLHVCGETGTPFFLKQMARNDDGSATVVSKPYLNGQPWLEYPKGGARG